MHNAEDTLLWLAGLTKARREKYLKTAKLLCRERVYHNIVDALSFLQTRDAVMNDRPLARLAGRQTQKYPARNDTPGRVLALIEPREPKELNRLGVVIELDGPEIHFVCMVPLGAVVSSRQCSGNEIISVQVLNTPGSRSQYRILGRYGSTARATQLRGMVNGKAYHTFIRCISFHISPHQPVYTPAAVSQY